MADQEPSASTSSVPASAESTDVGVEAMKLLGTGKRHMVMEDFVAAVNAFQDACRLLSTTHGEMAKECGEAYFCYGKALLELARMESGVLGNALQGVSEDNDDDEEAPAAAEDSKVENAGNVDEKEREELREQVYAALAEEKDDKPAEDVVPAENVSGDQDVVHEKTKGSTEKISKEEKKVKSPTGEILTTEHEMQTKIVSVDKDEPMDAVVDSHLGSGDSIKKGKVKDHATIPEDVKEYLGDKSSSGKEAMVEDASKEATTDTSVKSVCKIELEEKVAPPLKNSLGDQDKKSDTDEKQAQESLKDDESDKESTEIKITVEKTIDADQEDGTADSEEPMEEGEGASSAADVSEDENEEAAAEKDAESEEVDNLQLAWEMLELAKVIFKRQETKEAQLYAAQAYLKLGEVGIESENYIQAIEDFNECLNIQEKHLEPHNRLLAETYYQLGLAYSFNKQYDFSLNHFKESFSVIEKRLVMLTERIEKAEEKGKSPAKDNDAVSEDKREVEELKELLPEIKAKIEDSEESKDDGKATKALQETLSRTPAFSGFATESASSNAPASAIQAGKVTDEASTSSSNCISNISHLVRKKRKPEDSERDNNEPKKAKQEESAVNGGCGDTAHDRNGVPEKMESEETAAAKKSEPAAQSAS
ncbi:nuclear autoantigenic sperm protein isoform X2 [Heptranchias perlo]|uniref:nuclear autoantigenic sperm protein isoform X2 n=1 Tax=Heptranchias perlo TaxID=212740 RepID=UPI00355AC43C